MKMILKLRVIRRNSALALSTILDRLIWPSVLPLRSIAQQLQRGGSQHVS
jgi:hypothetical protein